MANKQTVLDLVESQLTAQPSKHLAISWLALLMQSLAERMETLYEEIDHEQIQSL